MQENNGITGEGAVWLLAVESEECFQENYKYENLYETFFKRKES